MGTTDAIRLLIYRASRWQGLRQIPGGWRFKRFGKRLVSDHYYRVPYEDGMIDVCPAYVSGRAVFFEGVYEPDITALIRDYVRAGFRFVDIGANIGVHTLSAAFAEPSAPVLAFEPDPKTFAVLLRNIEANGLAQVTCKRCAVGNAPGQMTLYAPPSHDPGQNTLVPYGATTPNTQIDVVTLDDVLAPLPEFHDRVLIKMDVEGYEPHVLEGGLERLSQFKNAAVIAEVIPWLIKKGERDVDDLLNLLDQAGFDRSYIIMDAETFNEAGQLYQGRWNMFFTKGAQAAERADRHSTLRPIDPRDLLHGNWRSYFEKA